MKNSLRSHRLGMLGYYYYYYLFNWDYNKSHIQAQYTGSNPLIYVHPPPFKNTNGTWRHVFLNCECSAVDESCLVTSPMQDLGNTAEEQAQGRLRERWGELSNVQFLTWRSCWANQLSSCDHLHKTYTRSSQSKWQSELGMGPQGPMLGGETINSQGVLREV